MRDKKLLPDPASLPGRDVVIFDGECRFCTAQVKALAKFDRGGRLSFLSLHDPRALSLVPDLTHDDLMDQLYVVTASGRRFGGPHAVRYFTRRLPALWLAAPFLHFPGSLPLWRFLYRQLARRRYWFGRVDCEGGTCRLPG